jgi:protocatechuate 3,4-dioxygenase beta subunit
MLVDADRGGRVGGPNRLQRGRRQRSQDAFAAPLIADAALAHRRAGVLHGEVAARRARPWDWIFWPERHGGFAIENAQLPLEGTAKISHVNPRNGGESGAMTDARNSDTRSHNVKRLVRLGLGVAAAGAIVAAGLAPGVLAQTMPAVPATTSAPTIAMTTTIGQTQTLTVSQTEGPYFKTNSPERASLVNEGTQGTLLTITGQVLAADGTPVANALLDFWQADASGTYDNSGYTLRGHQYTDENGYYTLTTVVPGLYPGRTRHIHVKVQAPGGPMLTTQLYFPGEARNATDGIFDPSLVLNTQTNDDGTQTATFNFVVQTA